jgi:SAM-dependent methyltransferase
MAREPVFRKDLYQGTAEYYDRYRHPYPAALFDDLRARVPLDGSSRVLDLACGTGQIAFALAGRVEEVIAIDQEAETIAFAQTKARDLGVANVHWIGGPAESTAIDGDFDLVAIGNAFHRLDRNEVARRTASHLRPHGCVALLWGGSPGPGDEPWERAFNATTERWRDALGVRDRVPEGWEQAIERDPHAEVLRRAGLSYEGSFDFPVVETWTVESLIGFVYSTSFLNRIVLGEHAGAFERDLRERLLSCCSDGAFTQDATYRYELARRAR